MGMANEYEFDVVAIADSALPNVSNGKSSTRRQFLVKCEFAQEFGLRLLGKFYKAPVGNDLGYESPELPAYFPSSLVSTVPQQLNMVASGFSVTPVDRNCFNTQYWLQRENPQDPEVILYNITDPAERDTQILRMLERYYIVTEEGAPASSSNCECNCNVTVDYTDPPWDCEFPLDPNEDDVWLLQTALSIEKTPSYEMYTLPNRRLEWVSENINPKTLKGDTYATVIVPITDIVVTWHNLPVSKLCRLESHLNKFRGCVNSGFFHSLAFCECTANSISNQLCSASINADPLDHGCSYEKDTVLFVNWEEQKEDRTTSFRMMNTTSVRMTFKQKRIVIDWPTTTESDVVGWNHLFCDQISDGASAAWKEVQYSEYGSYRPLFKRQDFNKIFTMDNPNP